MVDIQTAEFLWAQKYRPQKVDDIVLPAIVKEQIKRNIADGNVSNFIFDGPPGTGKTTLAYAIAKEIDADVLKLNGSGAGRGIDAIRNDVTSFCTAMSLERSRKIVLIDEADHLTNDAQAALRSTIEDYSKHVSFIFTTNSKYRLSDPVRSRFIEIDFKISKDEEKPLKIALLRRISDILKAEGIETLDKEKMTVLAQVIEMYFPNNRKILNTLQILVNNNNFDASSLTTISSDRFVDLCLFIKEKKWKKMREWVAENSDVNTDSIIKFLWENGEDTFGIEKMPMLIIHVDDYQKNVSMVRNPIISTVALFTKLMNL